MMKRLLPLLCGAAVIAGVFYLSSRIQATHATAIKKQMQRHAEWQDYLEAEARWHDHWREYVKKLDTHEIGVGYIQAGLYVFRAPFGCCPMCEGPLKQGSHTAGITTVQCRPCRAVFRKHHGNARPSSAEDALAWVAERGNITKVTRDLSGLYIFVEETSR